MTPSFGAYLAGSLSLVAIVASLGFGGYWLRRWIVPEFSGALARLAEVTLGVVLFVLALYLLGSVSLLREGWVVSVVDRARAGRRASSDARGRRATSTPVEPPKVDMWPFLIALGVASFTVAEWTFPSLLSLDRGMFGGDTTWYHMPFAARFAQDASIVDLHFTDPMRLVVWFYPATSELINGAGIILMHDDFLSPLLNLGWLAVGLLAAWCIGRPYGVAPHTLVASALVFDSGVMVVTQAGEGRNDIMAIAFLVAYVAFIINGHQVRRSGSLVTGDVADAGRADRPRAPDPGRPRRRPGDLGEADDAGAGGCDRGRGDPLQRPRAAHPRQHDPGPRRGDVRHRRLLVRAQPAACRQPDAADRLRARSTFRSPTRCRSTPGPRFSVAHYLFEPTTYRNWFFPQLENALGPFYGLILVVAFAAAIYVVFKSRNRMLQALAGAALLTAVVYLFTPLTAAGPEGTPRGFFTNTRYLMPGLVLALVLAPLARPLRSDEGHSRWTLGFLTALYALTVLSTPIWFPRYIVGTVLLTAALIWVPAWLGSAARDGITPLAAAGERGRGGGTGDRARPRPAGPVRREPLHRAELFLQEGGPVKAFRWARPQHDQRIGIAGGGEIFFDQYGFYGATSPTTSTTSACRAPTASTGWRPTAAASASRSTPATTTTW